MKRFNEIREELTEILIAEGGKPRKAAGAEVERLINTFQIAADAVTQMDQGRILPLAVTAAASGYQGMVKQVPIGAVSLISPFNFPLNLTAHKIAPAIAAGCPFVLKPASLTPVSALKLPRFWQKLIYRRMPSQFCLVHVIWRMYWSQMTVLNC